MLGLKGLDQANIIKKSVILFRLLNMTKSFFKFYAVHLPVRLDIETKFLISYFGEY